jgi:hypothetical protein
MVRPAAILTLSIQLAIFSAAGWVRAQEPVTPVKDAATDRLTTLADQLAADEFLVRETAMLELIAAGGAAIPAVERNLAGTNREAITRSLFVLEQLGLAAETAVQDAAHQALVRAATTREKSLVARLAAPAIEQLALRRASQAIFDLEQLGARVARSQLFDGVEFRQQVESIEIGPAFTGTAEDLRRLEWVVTSKVILVGPKIDDAWVRPIAKMPELEELHLYEAAVSDAAFAPLAEHPSLRHLGVYYTPLTDAALKHVTKIPSLLFLKLYGTKATQEGVAGLANSVQGTSVDFRRGAFLGVGCVSAQDGTCLLSTVHTNSPAAKGGLEIDDVLVRFGETKVADFDALTAQISQLSPGDQIEIEVRRVVEEPGGNLRQKDVAVKVKLEPWPLDMAVQQLFRR